MLSLLGIEWKLIIYENPLKVSLNCKLFGLHIVFKYTCNELKLCSAGVAMNASIG